MNYQLGKDIRAFANLLSSVRAPQDEHDADGIESIKCTAKLTKPSDIGQPATLATPPEKPHRQNWDRAPPSPTIWRLEEVKHADEMEFKMTPEYTMTFAQRVTTEDIYMQMGNKTPGTASCESMVYKISLPETKSKSDIALKISENELKCSTEKYRLNLHFPHPVNPTKSSAKWDQDASILVLTVNPIREFDRLNF